MALRPAPEPALRLADLLAALSLATDLGVGAPMETSLRTCLLATTLGARLGLPDAELSAVYYAALMRHLGCTAWAHEAAALAGDDHDLLRTFEGVDRERKLQLVGRAVSRLAPEQPTATRVRTIARVLGQPSAGQHLAEAQCAQAEALAQDLALGPAVVGALAQMYERHDGRGGPRRLRGEQLSAAGQLVHVAQVLEALLRQLGPDRALAELAPRRGRQFSPEVTDVALGSKDALELLFKVVGPDRVLFATENPGTGSVVDPASGRAYDDLKPVIEEMASLTEQDRRNVFECNCTRLYTRFRKDA